MNRGWFNWKIEKLEITYPAYNAYYKITSCRNYNQEINALFRILTIFC